MTRLGSQRPVSARVPREFPFFALCFFLSGATALIYEIVWVRLLTLTFGNTVFAVGAVLTAFMGGLSLGSYLFGKWSDRGVNLLKGYGVLEIGIAFFALLSAELLQAVTALYLTLSPADLPTWATSGLRFILSFIVLLFPTTLMGGTLPVLSRYFIRSEQELEKRLGALYSLNTVGGVLGTFLVGFFLIRVFGLSVTLRSTAAANVLIGLAAYYLGSRAPAPPATPPQQSGERPQALGFGYRFALAAFFLSGFTAMVYQASWTRLLVEVIGSTTYAFSLILMGFLIGIALGSLVVALVAGRRPLDLRHFSQVQLGIGLVAFLTLPAFNLMPRAMLRGMQWVGPSHAGIFTLEFFLVLVYILLPTTLFGATFPIIAGAYRDDAGNWGSRIGKIYAANTMGCILGSALVAFLFIPRFGSTISIKIAVAVNIIVGLAGLLIQGQRRLVAAGAVLLLLPFAPTGISSYLMDSGVAIYGLVKNYSLSIPGRTIIYQKEGPTATISVRAGDGSLALRTNGKTDASTDTDMATQIALGYLPVLLHPAPRSVIVVGLGSGVTIRAVRDFSEVRDIECVEIEPAVFEAAEYFTGVNGGIHHDPAVKYFIDDARSHLLASKKRYDIIISEPSNPWISGIGNLFSRDFFEAARGRLQEGGLFLQWLQLYSIRPDDMRMILATFSAVFPEVTLWQVSQADLIIIGRPKPAGSLDWPGVARRQAEVGEKLRAYLGVRDPMDLFSYYITDRTGIEGLTRGVPINTDDHPLLEFNAPLALYSDTMFENIRLLLNNLKIPPIQGYPGGDPEAAFLYRKSLSSARRGLPYDAEWIKKALHLDPLNLDYQVIDAAQLAQLPDQQRAARKKLEDILKNQPNHARAHYELALLLQATDIDQASSHLDQAVSLNSDDFDFLFLAGSLKLRKNDNGVAQWYFQRARAQPHPYQAASQLFYLESQCQQRGGDPEGALATLQQALKVNPYDGITRSAIGDLYRISGRKDEACREYENALSFTSDPYWRELVVFQKKTFCGS